MIRTATLIALIFSFNLVSQESQAQVSNADKPQSICLKGICFVGQEKSDPDFVVRDEGLSVLGVDIPGGMDTLETILAPKYLNCELTPGMLQSLKEDIVLFYRDNHHPLLAVDIPEQEIRDGILQINLIEARLETIVCRGNRWISDSQISKAIHVSPGDPIDMKQLLNNIAWFNRTPFHRTDAIFTPGTTQGATILELDTQGRFPLRPYIGGDNTGVGGVVGRARYFGGFNLNNLLRMNEVLSFQYTASSDFSELQSYTVHLTTPLPWQHLLIVYGGYSSNNPQPNVFKGTGNSSQVSGRYTIPLKPLYDSSMKELTLGFDWKNTNNNLQYVEFAPFIAVGSNVTIGQFVGGFDYANIISIHKLSFSLMAFWSPGEIFANQSNKDFQELRYKAKNKYVYGRLSVGDLISLPNQFTLATLLRLQLANQNLLPSEEFGLGGYDTVRGYDERELNVDNALCYNLELYTRPLEFKKMGNHQLKFLAFLDYGLGNNVHRLPDEPFTRYLLGAGAGVRYIISEYFSSRLDWGFKLHKIPFGDTSMGKLHVGMVLSY